MKVKIMKLLGKVQKQYNKEIVIDNNSVEQVSFVTVGYFSYQENDNQGLTIAKLLILETQFPFDKLETSEEYCVIVDRHMSLLGISKDM